MWKSIDGGTTFKPVFDKQPVQSIGAIAIDPTQPEDRLGRHRRGVDAQLRLDRRRHLQVDRRRRDLDQHGPARIPSASRKILVDPHERQHRLRLRARQAVERQRPSAASTRRPTAARPGRRCSRARTSRPAARSIAMDPKNPDVAFAGMWDFRRKGWTFRSGGDGPTRRAAAACSARPTAARPGPSSTDAANKGLPPKPWGRVAVAVAPSNPNDRLRVHRVDRLGAVPLRRRRQDLGAARPQPDAWSGGRSTSRNLIVDPKNPDRAVQARLRLIVSDGRRQELRRRRRRHARRLARRLDRPDQHRSTSSPATTAACGISYDGGNRWWKAEQPAGLAVLPRQRRQHRPVPRVRRPAGQQLVGRRLARIRAASPTRAGRTCTAATASGCSPIPTDPDYVYAESQGGNIGRINRKTHELARHPAAGRATTKKLRFNWNTPIARQPEREGHDLHRRAVPVPLARPRPDLGAHLAGPDDQRSGEAEAGGVGRRHGRQLRGRDAHDDLLDQRVAEERRT